MLAAAEKLADEVAPLAKSGAWGLIKVRLHVSYIDAARLPLLPPHRASHAFVYPACKRFARDRRSEDVTLTVWLMLQEDLYYDALKESLKRPQPPSVKSADDLAKARL